ncbi:retention module-containing protein [Halomonas stenophila]|uniref:VCBS repeat-containing protein n=1 Tax=Halomonas stenophila TaxID=795312 RepID=A0A7W5EVR9_9GAMM|nr:retention module-containing protein [Halomonas stenophila]MBB3232236.1 VCBS repeat-containing protein [Halomonas stenophila]
MTIATVLSITGQAWARDADGQLRELRVGDSLQEGETLVTSDNGRVILDFGDPLEPTTIGEGREVVMTPELAPDAAVEAADASAQDADLEALLTAIGEGRGDLLEDLDATAAGAGAGGGSDGGHGFVRLARISESVDPLTFDFAATALEGPDEVPLEGGAVAVEDSDDVPVVGAEDLDGDGVATEDPDDVPVVGPEDLDGDGVATEDPDDVPTVATPDPGGDGDVVWESALPEGSGGGTTTTSGRLQIDTGDDQLALIEVQDANGAWIAITADGTTVQGAHGTLTVDTDGGWRYSLDANTLDHAGTGLTGDADRVQEPFAVRVTDDDGDVSPEATLTLSINDDGPSITASVSDGDGVTLNTQDAELTDTATASFAAAFTVGSSAYGADGAGTTNWSYALELAAADGSDSGLTSGGDPVYLYLVGGEVIGATAASAAAVADVNTVFTLAVDASGSVTLTQRAALDHDTADTGDYASDRQGLDTGLVNLVGTVIITDGEGDTASDSETMDLGGNLLFDDDGPKAFFPQAAHVLLAVDAAEATQQPVTQSLNFLPGTDGLGDIVFDLALVDGKQAFLGVEGDQLYLHNEALYLQYTDDTHHGIQAVTESGDIGFEATIDTEGNVAYTVFSGSFMTDGKLTTVTELDGIGGGNVAFKGLNIGTKQAPDPDGTDDVLVSSEILPLDDTDQGTVNTTNATLGVGQGAEISSGEIVRFDLVNNLSVDDTRNAESYSFDGYQQTLAFSQSIVVSGGKEASFYLRIYSMGLENAATDQTQSLVSGPGGEGQLSLAAGEVRIYDETGIEQSGHVTARADGSVRVEGLQDGWSFAIVSVDGSLDPEAFNAVEIEGAELADGATTSLKLGGFSYGVEPSLSPVSFELPVTGEDADGDNLDGRVAITLYPDSESIVGDSQDNRLSGTGEDDSLFGLEGDDTLMGGQGDDVLAGGLGADTFAWQFGDGGDQGVPGTPASDLVADFNLNEADEGDALLLSDLLQDSDAGSDFANYLHAIDDGQGNTLLHVSTSGAFSDGFSSAESDQVIALNGVSMEGADSSAFIQSLIDSGQLDIE